MLWPPFPGCLPKVQLSATWPVPHCCLLYFALWHHAARAKCKAQTLLPKLEAQAPMHFLLGCLPRLRIPRATCPRSQINIWPCMLCCQACLSAQVPAQHMQARRTQQSPAQEPQRGPCCSTMTACPPSSAALHGHQMVRIIPIAVTGTQQPSFCSSAWGVLRSCMGLCALVRMCMAMCQAQTHWRTVSFMCQSKLSSSSPLAENNLHGPYGWSGQGFKRGSCGTTLLSHASSSCRSQPDHVVT